MKIGIVVPFSWSYWGGVVEHAENQAKALMALGHDVRIIIGNDPPDASRISCILARDVTAPFRTT